MVLELLCLAMRGMARREDASSSIRCVAAPPLGSVSVGESKFIYESNRHNAKRGKEGVHMYSYSYSDSGRGEDHYHCKDISYALLTCSQECQD